MEKFAGKVAFITGAARGIGRSHAITLAKQGADIAFCDIAGSNTLTSVPYEIATAEDVQETLRLVEALDRRCISFTADVRDGAAVQAAVDGTIAELGRVDFCFANAGIFGFRSIADMDETTWRETIDTNLTGVFNAIHAVLPHMIERGSGRIVATSSMAGKMGFPTVGHYAASKWGVIGLVKSVALEVAPLGITVNAICPSNANTPMINNPATYATFAPDLDNPTQEDVLDRFASLHPMNIPWVEAQDISNAAVFLCGEEARYITGETLAVAAGANAANAG